MYDQSAQSVAFDSADQAGRRAVGPAPALVAERAPLPFLPVGQGAFQGAPLALRRQTVLALQRSIGNAAVQRLVMRERAVAPPVRRTCACGGTPGPDGECAACRARRLGVQPATGESSPDQAQRQPQSQPQPASSLASTPAAAASPLPQAVLADHQRAITGGDLTAALRLVTRAMEQRGEIDTSKMAPATAQQGAAVCATTDRYVVDSGMLGALTTPCGCVGQAGSRLPNPRIQVGAETVRQATRLHLTLLHEYRHVVQEHARCNLAGTGGSGGGVCTDCNMPDEMDAYLAEIEAGYERSALTHPWVRVYVNWPYLAPEQQRVFQARRDAAQRKVDRHYPNVPWENNGMVATYRAHCERLTQRVRDAAHDPALETRGTCDDPLAPLSGSSAAQPRRP
jgi:hypothetical protein